MNEDLIWAAGLMDGEGTFYIAKDGEKFYPRMKLGMCHRDAVEKFALTVGCGNVVEEKMPGPMAKFRQYRWSTSGRNALLVAESLQPHLVVKAVEADLFLQWWPLLADGRKVFVTEENKMERVRLYLALQLAKTAQLVPV